MRKRTTTTHAVIHCSATKPSQDWGLTEIDRMHRKGGFFMVGYHIIIRRNGAIEYGRPLDVRGAHARDGGFNRKSVGVCLVGGISEKPQKHVPGNPWNGSDAENNFTDAQWKSLKVVLKGLKVEYPGIEIIGHRDIPGVRKACPSFDVAAWLADNPDVTA